jgi:hypothetical protein
VNWLLLGGGLVVLLFGFVLLYGAPYVPTLHPQRQSALELLDLRSGQLLLELGSGDGSILLAAAKRGIHSVGYELNPILALISRLRTWRYRKSVTIIWGNFWQADISRADGIYAFLLERYMPKLQNYLHETEHKKHLKVASFAFQMPDMKPRKNIKGMYLYVID